METKFYFQPEYFVLILEDYSLVPLPSSSWEGPINSPVPHLICKKFLTCPESELTHPFWLSVSSSVLVNVYQPALRARMRQTGTDLQHVPITMMKILLWTIPTYQYDVSRRLMKAVKQHSTIQSSHHVHNRCKQP